MKKWKIYLPLLSLCGALAVTGGIWGAMWGSTWNGQMELTHLEGDESALADFTLKGKIEDSQNTWDFSIEDGKLEKNNFHIGSGMETAYPIERTGGTWKEGELEVWSSYGTFVPAAGSQVETKDTVDLTVLKGNTYFPRLAYQEDGTLQGTTTVFDKGQAVFQLEIHARAAGGTKYRQWNYEIPTKLVYTPDKPLAEVCVENGEEYRDIQSSELWISEAPLLVWSKERQMLYGTMTTNKYCNGSIGLYCFGPDQAEDYTPTSGKVGQKMTEPVATLAEIPVSENRWLLGLEDVGEGLLVFIGEPDGVTLELYGYDGTLLDRLKEQTEQPVEELEKSSTKWENGYGIYLTALHKLDEDAYFIHACRGYWIADGKIQNVFQWEDEKLYGTEVAVGKEQVLMLQHISGDLGEQCSFLGNMTLCGLDLKVYDIKDDPAGKLVYHGEMKTDIEEDVLAYFSRFYTREKKTPVGRQQAKMYGMTTRSILVERIEGKEGAVS